ncbi:unnamed protein product [Adineta steineri]|uniref:Kelch motif family protein n=1 Tax=Adineta steineri TaxID=433720 RepID=A0A813QSI0_9BILA|nr:unnamed protein product [Adineta steineri]
MIQQLYHEPIYSVQQQQQSYFHVKQLKHLTCKSNHSDECYRNYLEKNFSIGFGQLREVEYEKIEFAKPSLVILSPTLEINELEIMKLTDKLTLTLENLNQYRKRYAIIHTDDNSYIIGGYIFDPINKLRQIPNHDFKYNRKTESLQTITSLPNMNVSFGLATDGKYIVIIGGHTPSNKPSAQCYIMEINNLPEKWISLPDLPLPISGSGVGMIDGEIHVIGGFDILSSVSITHGEYYRLIWTMDTQWKQLTSIEPMRARSLVISIPNENISFGRIIYVAGGYNVNVKRRPMVVSTIHMYEEKENKWKFITHIPNFKLIHGLSFYDDKLHVSESILNEGNESDSRIIRSYDFQTNQWIELSKNS